VILRAGFQLVFHSTADVAADIIIGCGWLHLQ
jgi:hypothetical protein